MHICKTELDKKCQEVIKDINDGKPRSSAWLWMGLGAISGLILSCLRIKRNDVKPILAFKDTEINKNGKSTSKWNSQNNKGRGSK